MKKLIIILMALIAYSTHVFADKVSFTASAPDAVVVGEQFRLSYIVTTQKVKDFRAPSIKGFDVLMGPSRSQQSSTQIVNGNVTSTSSITFTYILMANNAGEYTIPGASIIADGDHQQLVLLPQSGQIRDSSHHRGSADFHAHGVGVIHEKALVFSHGVLQSHSAQSPGAHQQQLVLHAFSLARTASCSFT